MTDLPEVKMFLWDFNDCWVSESSMNWLIENNAWAALSQRFHAPDSEYVKKWTDRYNRSQEDQRKFVKELMQRMNKKSEEHNDLKKFWKNRPVKKISFFCKIGKHMRCNMTFAKGWHEIEPYCFRCNLVMTKELTRWEKFEDFIRSTKRFLRFWKK